MTEPRRSKPQSAHSSPGQGRAKPSSKGTGAGPARVSPARRAAFEILERVGRTSAHSDDLLYGPGLSALSQADRDLTTALVLGVLRWQIALDGQIRPFLSRPDAELAEPVAIVLRLGVFQLVYMERIPPHAALNESVELVRLAGHPHASGMVNAVLRKLVGAPPARRPLVESIEAMAARLGHPRWLVEGWVHQYGRAAAEAICTFDQSEPPCENLFAPEPESAPLPTMDPGSRLVAELAVATAGAKCRRMWDCCAAPGGKTLVLARRAPDAELLATDANPTRLKRLKERLQREAPERTVQVAEADASALPASFGHFDLILCDVPCSGTGTLARNPEIRHRLWPEDLPEQAERQKRILSSALAHLAPGGTLLYSTCSLEGEECEGVVETVLEDSARDFTVVPLQQTLQQLTKDGRILATPEQTRRWLKGAYLRTLPGAGFTGDGFFAACIRRR